MVPLQYVLSILKLRDELEFFNNPVLLIKILIGKQQKTRISTRKRFGLKSQSLLVGYYRGLNFIASRKK